MVLPVYRSALAEGEDLALAFLRRNAPGIDRYIVAPEGVSLAFAHDDFNVLRVTPDAMRSVDHYSRMMCTAWFYRLFAGYRAILIYQLDCLLLRADLEGWAARGWSYIGAPWFVSPRRRALKAVGNGGFSLRRPDHALAVLTSERFRLWPFTPQQMMHFLSSKHAPLLSGALARARRESGAEPLAARFVRHLARPEDEFWSYYAPFFHPDYRVAPAREAIDFAFENRPRDALAVNGGRLPLGCHAWARMDPAFWRDTLKANGLDPAAWPLRPQPPP